MIKLNPSAVRNKLEVRVRRLSGRKSLDERIQASREGIAIWSEYLDYMEQQRKRKQRSAN
ncbi:MAG: hypothetical protein LC687_00520 [Actinobacteria bacterium]|nr:hypothetical protein [Actinomycetota bacterium]MCA1806352.1 hypothetical protein [Actinomycetota bacterium]